MIVKIVKLKAKDIDIKLNMIHIKVVNGRKDIQRFILTLDMGYRMD